MKVDVMIQLRSIQMFVLVYASSVLHEMGILDSNSQIDKIGYVGFPIIVLAMSGIIGWLGYAALAGKNVKGDELRSTRYPERNGLLCLWTGASSFVLQIVMLLNVLMPSTLQDIVLACGGVFVVMAIAVQALPTRARQIGG